MDIKENTTENTLLAKVETYIIDFFDKKIDASKYVYHDLQHTYNVVTASKEIAVGFELAEKEIEILQLAAWFHDTGYDLGPVKHEERGATYAETFLQAENYPQKDIEIIKNCILATQLPQKPKNLLEEIICDADLSHLGMKTYWDRCGRVRQEISINIGKIMSEQDWINFELDFIVNHQYFTAIAQGLYNKRKKKNIRQLLKQKLRLNPREATENDVLKKNKTKKGANGKKPRYADDFELKDLRLGRGVETMYRATYRTHINLSSIADNKANIMLSINAIILSITVSTLVPSFDDNPKLIIPTFILLTVCLISIVYATLSTRPKITEGKFTRADIEQKRGNLLFFGNFYNMELDDFHWGMMEMIKDQDFLYSSMTRDLYYLGVVLAKKYRFLSICYGVFMYGLILTTIAFAVSYLWQPGQF